MAYDTDTVLKFGAVGEAILTNPVFNEILEAWDHTTVVAMLATKPEQREERERLFTTINATREFIGFINEFVQEARRMSEAPDPMAQIDDPAVHDIHRETDYQ